MLRRMPEMDAPDAPRALVIRPRVKGNEALGRRLDDEKIVGDYVIPEPVMAKVREQSVI